MDAKTRKTISVIITLLEEAKERLDDESMTEVSDAADAEQAKYDNLGERAQQGENGQKIEAAAQALASASDEIEAASGSLDEAIAHLNEAIE